MRYVMKLKLPRPFGMAKTVIDERGIYVSQIKGAVEVKSKFKTWRQLDSDPYITLPIVRRKLEIQVKMEDEGIIVDIFEYEDRDYDKADAIASTYEFWGDMGFEPNEKRTGIQKVSFD